MSSSSPPPPTRLDALRAERSTRPAWQDIAKAEKETDIPNESEIEHGNYRKGKFRKHGMLFTIETAAGTTRRGVNKATGKKWSVKLKDPYGYINFTDSAEPGDQMDFFFGPCPESEIVHVIDQNKQDGTTFDEHKVVFGVYTTEDAIQLYRENYSVDWAGFRACTPLTIRQFRTWLREGNMKTPISEQPLASYYTKQADWLPSWLTPTTLTQPIENGAKFVNDVGAVADGAAKIVPGLQQVTTDAQDTVSRVRRLVEQAERETPAIGQAASDAHEIAQALKMFQHSAPPVVGAGLGGFLGSHLVDLLGSGDTGSAHHRRMRTLGLGAGAVLGGMAGSAIGHRARSGQPLFTPTPEETAKLQEWLSTLQSRAGNWWDGLTKQASAEKEEDKKDKTSKPPASSRTSDRVMGVMPWLAGGALAGAGGLELLRRQAFSPELLADMQRFATENERTQLLRPDLAFTPTQKSFQDLADYSALASRLANSKILGVPAETIIRWIRSTPFTPESARWKDDSHLHYRGFAKGPLSGAMRLLNEHVQGWGSNDAPYTRDKAWLEKLRELANKSTEKVTGLPNYFDTWTKFPNGQHAETSNPSALSHVDQMKVLRSWPASLEDGSPETRKTLETMSSNFGSIVPAARKSYEGLMGNLMGANSGLRNAALALGGAGALGLGAYGVTSYLRAKKQLEEKKKESDLLATLRRMHAAPL